MHDIHIFLNGTARLEATTNNNIALMCDNKLVVCSQCKFGGVGFKYLDTHLGINIALHTQACHKWDLRCLKYGAHEWIKLMSFRYKF